MTEAFARQLEQYLELRREGTGEVTAAIAVGWSPKQLNELKKDPEIAEMIDVAITEMLETIEKVCLKEAMSASGSFQMKQFVLLNKGRHRGWQPPTQKVSIDHRTTIEIAQAHGAAATIRALLEQATPEQLQSGEYDDIIDAEVLDGITD